MSDEKRNTNQESTYTQESLDGLNNLSPQMIKKSVDGIGSLAPQNIQQSTQKPTGTGATQGGGSLSGSSPSNTGEGSANQ